MDLEFSTPTKGKITGSLKAVGRPNRLLLLCHGLNSSQDHPAIREIARQLHQKGHALFGFDFSAGPTALDIRQQVADIETVIKHFQEYRGFVVLSPSFGAVSAAIATTRLPAIT